jgi:predicted nucleotidyltransferase
MKSTLQNDPVLRFFKASIMEALGSHLQKVMLFGSRARGDATAESDYDLLVIVDQINASVTKGIDAIAGEALIRHSAVLSAFPITEHERENRRYSPMLINVAREGMVV